MTTKLTLKLKKSIIDKAIEYAEENKTSLSKLIENHLLALTYKRNRKNEISPLVESLIGVIHSEDIDYKKDYTNYLFEKYK